MKENPAAPGNRLLPTEGQLRTGPFARGTVREATRERILEGAMKAVSSHGLSKLEMTDVSASAGVSRGTLYRYFSNREELLHSLTIREAQDFWKRCVEALEACERDDERLKLLMLHATRYVSDHAALQRLLETDPAFVLCSLRQSFTSVRDELGRLLAPALENSGPVKAGVVSVDQLVDWLTRILVTTYLFPIEDSAAMESAMESMHGLLVGLRGSDEA
ncbi:MAG: TetR/AcrR family transcriptional regulator [Proteobacteria bacterium]|nr:TetR/AcrR family transcriptional regulator [Pseudomonadota bacterium]